jgi:hypothetical protein
MALAMNLSYCQTHDNHYPLAAGGPGIHPGLSWRVTILPYVEEEELYGRFHLDEPWDSPHNLELLPKMPKMYVIPGAEEAAGRTHYRVFVGPTAAFERPGPAAENPRGHRPEHFPAGSAKTILVVEAAEAVPWTKPEELEYDPQRPVPPLLDLRGYAQASMVDASVQSIRRGTPESELRSMIERGRN